MDKYLARLAAIICSLLLAGCTTGNDTGLPLPGFGDTTDPTIAVAGLADGATVSGTIAISAAASDNVGVTAFNLTIDGTEVASAANGQLTYSWVTTGATNAAHTLVFTASDAAGNDASTTLNATVNNAGGGGDTEDPVIGIAGVTNGTEVNGTVAITVTVTDNVGVTSTTLDIDGTEVASSANGSLAYSWVTTGFSNAAHSLVFEASDAAGNIATQTLSVPVNNGAATSSLSGTVFAPNGTDPVAGALIFIEDSGASAVGDPPTEPYIVYAYSDDTGVFSLTGVPLGLQAVHFQKGPFSKVINIDVQPGENVLSTLQTTLPSEGAGGAEDILVVTGDFDRIENLLGKLGLGTVNSFGLLELGTETFKLVDGNNSLAGTYPDFNPFFATPSNYADYRTIFLNCGIQDEDTFFDNPAAVAGLKAWVEAGGRLYCTDWSYNFVEQMWPTKIDFASFGDPDGFSATPEGRDLAKVGVDMATLNCHIEDAHLALWMSTIGASTAGDMFETVDWLTAWVPIDGVSGVKVWATGTPPGNPLRSMTVTFEEGTGQVLYSSYHTEEAPSTEIKPQERVLQYLIFEIL